MELATIVEDPHVARRAFLDYRAQLRRPVAEKASAVQKELRQIDEELMRAYRELARGVTLLRLSETILAGGYEQRGEEGRQVALPRLAIAAAASRKLWTQGISTSGALAFSWERTPRWNDLSHAAGKSVSFGGLFTGDSWARRITNRVYEATVPTVPPQHRPDRLAGYHVLFEATWEDTPEPADPALLKHVGGDLWAVLATWDLTPLEAAVLGRSR